MYFVVTAIVLLAIATAIQFTGFTTAAIWSVEATALLWAGVYWKKRWIWLAGLALMALAVGKMLATPGFLSAFQVTQFTALFNLRAVALAVFAASCALGAWFFSKVEHTDAFYARRALSYAWVVALFLLMTLEVNDAFRKLIYGAFGEQKVALDMYRNMYLAAIWMLYSLPLVYFGLKRQNPPLFLSGIGVISIAIGLGGAWAMSYAPIERFAPLANVRAALLAFLIVGTILHAMWLAGIRRRYHRLEALLHFTWGLLLFELCTVETNDYFRKAMEFSTDTVRAGLVFGRFMTLAAVWMALSLPLVRLGLARKMRPTLYLGLWTLLLSLGMAAVRGIAFDPIENYSFVLNYRTIIIVLVIAGALIQATWIKYSGQMFGMLYGVLNALRIAIAVLILVLLTAETRDYFQKQIFLSSVATSGPGTDVSSLENMKQLCLSGIWLLYSIALMGFGLWKRNRTIRLISIALFGIAILKVFFYDLSFLDTVYRIVSFVALGVILLVVSYLYQRYKAIILEPTPEFDDRKGKAQIVV